MADEADRSEYYIESVIDDHVKEAMRRQSSRRSGSSEDFPAEQQTEK